VIDDGTGMDAETARHIFEPFFTTKDEGKGTGLGLATVFGIVRQSRGAIRVSTRPRQGTTFEIFLPQVPGGEAVPGVPVAAEAERRGSGTILLVEDEAAVRELLRSELVRAGYDVLMASSGSDAWQKVEGRGEPVDLVVTDVVMPGMRGPDLVARLRAKWPELRVLFVSGWQDPDRTRLPELDDATRFLQKPFDPEQLLTLIAQMLPRD
jgi:CheY-like chemotaxis protein